MDEDEQRPPSPKPGPPSTRFGFGTPNLHLPHMPKMKDIHVPDIPEGTRTGAFSGPRFDDEGNELSWSYTDLVINWCENTSVHGIKFVTEKSDLKVRKFIWLIVVLTFSILLTIQVVQRVAHFKENPKAVNVEKVSSESLIFPTITFCNENKYKMSKAAIMGYYAALEAIDKGHYAISIIGENVLKTLETSTDVIVNNTAFELTDMLIDCVWQGKPCGLADFKRSNTDQGICYSFNRPGKENNLKRVNLSGLENSLTLILNVEQYDYMPQRFGASGIRFMAHWYYEYPALSDIGLGAPTGSHTFVSMKTIESTKLKPPFQPGCSDKTLPYFNVYHESNCQAVCKTAVNYKNCNCVPQHQKKIAEKLLGKTATICTLKTEVECVNAFVKPLFENLSKRVGEVCNCPVACQSISYEPSLSQSNMASNELLMSNDLIQITEKNKIVRNIGSVLESDIYENDIELIKQFSYYVDKLKVTYLQNLTEFLNFTKTKLNGSLHDVKEALTEKTKLYEEQRKMVRRHFTHRYILADRVTMSLVGHGMNAFLLKINRYINALMESQLVTHENFRNHTYFLAKIYLNIQIKCTKSAIKKLDFFQNCFRNAIPCNKNVRLNRYMRAVIPKLILRRFENVSFNNESWLDLKDHLNKILRSYHGLMKCLDDAHNSKFQQKLYTIYSKMFETYAKRWITNYSPILKAKFLGPSKSMEKRRARIDMALKDVNNRKEKFFNEIDGILSNISHVAEVYLATLLEIQEMSMTFVNCQLLHKRNCPFRKDELADKLQLNNFMVTEAIKGLNEISDQLKLYKLEWTDVLHGLRMHEMKTWNFVYGDLDAQDQYAFHNISWSKERRYPKIFQLMKFYRKVIESLDVLIDMSPVGNNVSKSLHDLKERMFQYNKNNALTSKFVIDNFVKITFYFEDLNIKRLTEEASYTITSLMSDVGGTLGLFIGMSLLSVVEVLDLFFQTVYHRPNKKNSSQEESTIDAVNPNAADSITDISDAQMNNLPNHNPDFKEKLKIEIDTDLDNLERMSQSQSMSENQLLFRNAHANGDDGEEVNES